MLFLSMHSKVIQVELLKKQTTSQKTAFVPLVYFITQMHFTLKGLPFIESVLTDFKLHF